MTILMTTCPYCSSNYMLLDTTRKEGKCAQCAKEKSFSDEEVAAAEARRDKLSEQYLGRLEKAYKGKDYSAMSSLATEVAGSGISSWYAWFCIGWYDLHEGRTGQAFDDFKLAAQFLDEENFDEFYELTMEASLESLEEAARTGETWLGPDATLVEFTGVLFERFEHLCTDGDFMCDFVYRIGFIEVETAAMGANLITEIMLLLLDFYSGNTFIPDQLQFVNNAIASSEAIDGSMQDLAKDKTMSPNLVKIWGQGFREYLEIIKSYNDGYVEKYDDEQMLSLCDYWGIYDYDDVFTLFQISFEHHVGFVKSGKRNKGILKKRDKALEDYSRAFIRPLEEGLTDDLSEEEGDYDRICPDCGNPLKADENGLIRCECGFKSRVVTDDIANLPENVPELIIMGRKAYEDRDPVQLNNIGERILEFDEDNWYGHLTLSSACSLDGELGESMMLAVQAGENLPDDGVDEFSERVTEDICSAMLNVEDTDDLVAVVLLPSLISVFDDSPAIKSKDIPMSMVNRLMQGKFDSSVKGMVAVLFVRPAIVYEIYNNTNLANQRAVAVRLIELLEKIQEESKSYGNDQSGSRSDLLVLTRCYIEVLQYLVDGIDSRLSGVDVEKIGYMAGYWKANIEEFDKMVEELTLEMMDVASGSNTKKMLKKSKHRIDVYLDQYMKAAEL